MARSETYSVTGSEAPSFSSWDTHSVTSTDARPAKKHRWHKRFAYQKLAGWRPILSPHIAELFFLAAGVLLIALGVPILVASLNVVEVRVPYGFHENAALTSGARQANQEALWAAGGNGITYDVPVTIEDRMEPPIYVAYELGTYFQNFRRYVRSYDPARMHDGSGAGGPVSACQPFSYLDDDESLPINPCGQIAHSFFNDTFAFTLGGADLPVDSSNIAWASDREHLYGAVPAENYNPGGADAGLRGGNTSEVVLNQNQRWMVWMRPHSQVAAQKLYGVINQVLEPGASLVIQVTNRYNTYEFNGAKTLILSTNSWVGGRNNFLGICYLVVGGLCLLTALFFFAGYDLGLIWKREYGDMANVSWLRQHADDIKQQQEDVAAGASGNGRTVQDEEASDGLAAAAPPPKNG